MANQKTGAAVTGVRILRADTKKFADFLDSLERRGMGSIGDVESRVGEIISDVIRHGDSAVRRYTEQFDNVRLRSFKIPKTAIKKAWKSAGKRAVRAIEISADRIMAFHARQKEESWSFQNNGALMGQLIRPLERVGVYVPGGKASYPSSVLMNVIPAQVAGVDEILICVPMPGGQINPYVLVAADMLGVKKIFGIGGAQAIAAMAYGTRSLPKVDKIVGPGNIYVATAKRMVFGAVDIDMIAGPSEILVIADDTADPGFVAADMLAQAEHDEIASAMLVTPSRALAKQVNLELVRQMKKLRRKAIASKSLESYGAVVITPDLEEAVRISNRIAPEHLEVMTSNPEELLPEIRNAGAVFLGSWTPEALGDYVAGPNHTLPTGGSARFFSPLGVYDFIKRSSLISFTKEAFGALSGTVQTMAGVEGLDAHAKSVRIRSEKIK